MWNHPTRTIYKTNTTNASKLIHLSRMGILLKVSFEISDGTEKGVVSSFWLSVLRITPKMVQLALAP